MLKITEAEQTKQTDLTRQKRLKRSWSPNRLVTFHFKKAPGNSMLHYRGADKSLARPTSRCILFDGENISFESTNIPPIMIIDRIHEYQNLLSL